MGRLHTRSYKAVAEYFPELGVEVELVAAADPIDSVREEATGKLGFKRAYADYHELLADPEVDIVSIASPNSSTRKSPSPPLLPVSPFWIEKPMGVSAEQSREIAQAAEKAGLVSAVGFNYRHTPAIEYMRTLVREGKLGRLTNVRVWFIADYNSSPLSPLTWRASRKRLAPGSCPT